MHKRYNKDGSFTKKGGDIMTRTKKVVLLPDIHYPHYNHEAFQAVLKFIKWFKPNEVNLIGDAMNMDTVNHWKKDKGNMMYFEGKRMKGEYEGFDIDILKPIEKVIPPKCHKVYMGGNHECLDDKTELLTKRGWIKYTDIKPDDLVLSHNRTGIEWVSIDRIITYPYKGYLNSIETDTISMLTTDDHKLFYLTPAGKIKFVEVGKLTGARYRIPTNGIIKGKPYDISDDTIRIIAWLLTDGNIEKHYHRITFYQSGNKHKLITDILDRLGIRYTLTERRRLIYEIDGVQLKSQKLQYEIRIPASDRDKILRYIKPDKSIPDWVSKLDKRQFDIFLSSLIDGDGSRRKDAPAMMLYGKKNFLEQIQILAIQQGWSASLSTYRKVQYRLNLCQRPVYNLEVKNKSKKWYSGIVWDLTVKNHNFMVRRNGKPYFTGNCWVNQVIERNPQLEGMIEPEICLHLKERNWEWIPYIIHNKKDGTWKRGTKQYGKLLVFHGQYTNKYHAAKTVSQFSKSVAYGHTHDIQSYTYTTQDDYMSYHTAQSIGCLANLSPEYLKGRANKWVNAFGILYVRPDGNFNLYVPVIIKGIFTFANRTFDGNK